MNTLNPRWIVPAALALLALPRAASAQSTGGDGSPSTGPLHLLNETAAVVDVVDALDTGSTWSFRLTAGYQFRRRTMRVERELGASGAMSGLGTTPRQGIGDYTESTHTLNLGAELGLFHDLALTFGLPVVLSNTRTLRGISGVPASALADGWQSAAGAPTSLFSLAQDFASPERSGIDQVRIGLQWSIFNQQRDRHRPTWTVTAEWRPPVGSQMTPCAQTSGGTLCPQTSSVPPVPDSGIRSMSSFTRAAGPSSTGVGRGLHGLFFQTMIARRVGYVEPYAGFDILAEFPTRDSPFRYFDTPYGLLSNFPPIAGSLTVGVEIVPWENRETWQKLAIDLRARGTYRSQGRDYSALYDALGTSSSVPLLQPGCPSNVRYSNGACQPGREVYFDGLTTTGSHVILGGQFNVMIQPARFLRFIIGGAVSWVAPHTVTQTDACNPNQSVDPQHPEWRGGCVSNSAPDPSHRAVIDSPGNRFYTTNDVYFDFSAAIAVTPRFF